MALDLTVMKEFIGRGKDTPPAYLLTCWLATLIAEVERLQAVEARAEAAAQKVDCAVCNDTGMVRRANRAMEIESRPCPKWQCQKTSPLPLECASCARLSGDAIILVQCHGVLLCARCILDENERLVVEGNALRLKLTQLKNSGGA